MIRNDVVCLVRNALDDPENTDTWATLDEYLWEDVLEAIRVVHETLMKVGMKGR